MAWLKGTLVVAVACLAVVSARPLSEANDTSVGQREYDYFVFVRQWPGTFCSTHACPLLHKQWYRFTIHGLWPNYDDGTWPEYCDKEKPFDEEEIEDLLPQMQEIWPSYFNKNEDFWAHEWNRHGTCTLPELHTEHKFFKTVLKLHYKFYLENVLQDAGIVPSDKVHYKKSEIIKAISDAYGAEPMVHCEGGKLTEMWMCLDRDMTPFTCKDAAAEEHKCEEIMIPPLPGRDYAGYMSEEDVAALRLKVQQQAEDDSEHAHSHEREADDDDDDEKEGKKHRKHEDDDEDDDEEDRDHDHDHDSEDHDHDHDHDSEDRDHDHDEHDDDEEQEDRHHAKGEGEADPHASSLTSSLQPEKPVRKVVAGTVDFSRPHPLMLAAAAALACSAVMVAAAAAYVKRNGSTELQQLRQQQATGMAESGAAGRQVRVLKLPAFAAAVYDPEEQLMAKPLLQA